MNQVEHYAQHVSDNVISFAPKVFVAVFILWIGFKLHKKIDFLLSNSLERLNISDTMRPFIISLVAMILKIILVLIAVSILRVQLSGLVTVVAVMGFAIGLSVQGRLGNFASGILIFLLKPYNLYDCMQLDDKFGKVEGIGIFNTLLVTPVHKTLIVPNAKITDSVVTNFSKNGLVRLELNTHIPYAEDFPKVQEMITTVLANTPLKINGLATEIGIKNFDSHNIILAIRHYVLPDNYWEGTFETHKAIKQVFSENNIRVAYSEGIELGSIGK
ncbi:MAG: small conductance mechanosensitive channel [Maribacter sp.]|jgi:small conductance mechanosensitive channel